MSVAPPRVGIVGGGVLGTSLALRLAQAGAEVTVLERGPELGGLAGTIDFGGHTVDRFYHVITPADSRMIAMAEELGLGEQLRFRPVGAGFFADGEMHDFNGLGDLLALRAAEPARRGCGSAGSSPSASCGAATRRSRDSPLETWLRRHCGQQVRRADLEAAAELALRRRLVGAARDLPLGPDPTDVRGAQRQGRGRRGDGPHRRRAPAADRRDGRAGPGARRRGAHRRAGERVWRPATTARSPESSWTASRSAST